MQLVKTSGHGTEYAPVFTIKGRIVSHRNLEVLKRYARRYRAGKYLTAMYVVPSKMYTAYEYRQY
jgi:hypothetical protein